MDNINCAERKRTESSNNNKNTKVREDWDESSLRFYDTDVCTHGALIAYDLYNKFRE
jgi:hypothetical protein